MLRHKHLPDQDRGTQQKRARREIQPAAPDRRTDRSGCGISADGCISCEEVIWNRDQAHCKEDALQKKDFLKGNCQIRGSFFIVRRKIEGNHKTAAYSRANTLHHGTDIRV